MKITKHLKQFIEQQINQKIKICNMENFITSIILQNETKYNTVLWTVKSKNI